MVIGEIADNSVVSNLHTDSRYKRWLQMDKNIIRSMKGGIKTFTEETHVKPNVNGKHE